MHATLIALFATFLGSTVLSAPTGSLDAGTFLQNGQDAQILNTEFLSLNANDTCEDGQMACIQNSIAHCRNTTWSLQPCDSSSFCFAMPSVREEGTVLSCTSNATAAAIIGASGATGGIFANSTSNTVDLPIDCNDDDESDPVSSNSTMSSTAASSTHTHKAHHSTATSDTSSTIDVSATATGATSTAHVVTVTSTVFATSLPSETFTFNASEASSFLSSIATESGVSVTTISPSSVEASVTATVTTTSVVATFTGTTDSSDSSASSISSKPVGIASSPASATTSGSAAKTITLNFGGATATSVSAVGSFSSGVLSSSVAAASSFSSAAADVNSGNGY